MKNKILIIGYGSIGKRHGEVLDSIGNQVAFLRTGKSSIDDSKFLKDKNIFYNLENAINEFEPTYVVDCSPSIFHFGNLKKLFKLGVNALIEKPLIVDTWNPNELKILHNIANNQIDLKYGLSFQYRFHPIINKLKTIFSKLNNKEIISGKIIWTEYLPNWHPWEDYKNSYASNKELGGGSLLTMCHPLDYLIHIIGDVSFNLKNKFSGRLNIDVEQASLISCESNLTINPIEIYIDFDSKINRHEIYLDGKDWSINADLLKNNLKSKVACMENISLNYGIIDRNSLFKSLHQEYQNWISGKGTYRNDLVSNLNLINFLGNNRKNIN